MTYSEATEFLFNRLAAFHRKGEAAYKPGLDTTLRLSAAFGNPHQHLRVIHVGGTNGKGSVSHMLASILQSAGYRVGLYTSPHLVDFAERIRVNGQPVPHDYVTDFVERFRALDIDADPSFFELSTVLAFKYFADRNVDFAVIEVGLGGRLDSTNIVSPVLSVITNISLDHVNILGDTRAAIAAEKAGIIKHDIPAVIGETDSEVTPVFVRRAAEVGTTLTFAQETPMFSHCEQGIALGDGSCVNRYDRTPWGTLTCPLTGDCQPNNAHTVLAAVKQLTFGGIGITAEAVRHGLESVVTNTGLKGRWQTVDTNPRTIIDTGHNIGAWTYLAPALARLASQGTLRIVLGFVADKDLSHILPLLPHNAVYHFTQPSTPRALAAADLAAAASAHGIRGSVHQTVASAIAAARQARPDTIYIGGSTFVVADFLAD